MKNTLIIVTVVIGSYLFFGNLNADDTRIAIQRHHPALCVPIKVVFFQDASGSIKNNGVELTCASEFRPYFNDIYRDIDLSFGVINSNTAEKLITVELPQATFQKPEQPNISSVSITEQKRLKDEFAVAFQIYQHDSELYYADRTSRFATFCAQVDRRLEQYQVKLSDTTDLIPAFKIADKAFNFSFSGHPQNFLLINSDGIDSYKRIPSKLQNKVTTVLINANGLPPTDTDTFVTITLTSTEQAIKYTLSNHH